MINCLVCNHQIDEETNFCPVCGEYQKTKRIVVIKESSNVLTILCILTFIGSLFTIVRALFYQSMSDIGFADQEYYRGWIYAASSIGTIVGAIVMLMYRKLNGLYIYSAFQILYLITVIVASLSYGDNNIFALFVASFFIIPSIILLILFWASMTRKHLEK